VASRKVGQCVPVCRVLDNELGKRDHQAGLRSFGYPECWGDEAFVQQNAMKGATEFRLLGG
jgi:hypothetical protein